MTKRHVCGLSGKVFRTEEEYLEHTSPATGFSPKDLEHQGTRGVLVAKAAIARGGKLKKKIERELDEKMEVINKHDINHKLMEAKRKMKSRRK